MAPKKGTKRAAATQEAKAATPVEKKARPEPKPKADQKFKVIVDAINRATDLSDSCRKMLLAMIPGSLGAASDERHETQHVCVKMIGEALELVACSLQTSLDEQNAKLEEVDRSKSDLVAKLQAAETAVVEAATAENEKKQALAEAARAMANAKATLQEKQDAKRSGDAALARAEGEKAALTKAIEVDLKAIVNGELEPGSAEAHYTSLKPAVDMLALEDSLTVALPATCVRPKAQWGLFDNMVMEQLEKALTKKVDELTALLDAGATSKKEREDAEQAATAEFEGAKALNQNIAEEFSAMQAASKQASAAASQAKAEVEAVEPKRLEIIRNRDAKAAELEEFKQCNMGTFELFRDTLSKPVASASGEEARTADPSSTEGVGEVVQAEEKTQPEEPVVTLPSKVDVATQDSNEESPVAVGGA